jgi:cyclase
VDELHLGGVPAWELKLRYGLTEADLAPYLPADLERIERRGVEVHYLGYYLKWHPQSCYYHAVEHGGFEASPERTPGTYSKYNSIDDKIDDFHYWTTYQKFGIGRATYDAAQEIRSGDIEREEGVALVQKFDGEWPARFAAEVNEYLSVQGFPAMTDARWHELARKFRSPHLWDGDKLRMSLLRIIARLDIKGPNVVKGVQMEGLRVVGKPDELARRYAEEGADELLYIDTVASLYGRNQLSSLLERTVENVFVPITVGGGIKSRADVKRLLDAGADKVAINTAAIRDPSLIRECADHYGSQAIVVSIEAKRKHGEMAWECFTDCGREKGGKDVVLWAQEAVSLGAGEILLTSVDQDGTRKGFDLDLIRAVGRDCPVPLTACGGLGSVSHGLRALEAGADAVACASVLHYGRLTIGEIRNGLTKSHVQAAA